MEGIFRSIFNIAVPLFFVLNIIGNLPLFIGLLTDYSEKERSRIMMREMLIALLILFLFFFFGDWILARLGISQPVIGVAGGLLLILIALGMIFPKHEDDDKGLPEHEPFVVPLATPGIAGPGSIAAVMVYSGMDTTREFFVMPAAIFLAWLPSVVILLTASKLSSFLGEKGMIACERLGGMIISLIGVGMFLNGIINLVKESFPGLS